jgi:hypothetical protein
MRREIVRMVDVMTIGLVGERIGVRYATPWRRTEHGLWWIEIDE